MVDLALLQSVSYIAGALGVCIAATYYVVNLRETTKNRRATFANLILQSFQSEEGAVRWVDILSMKWNDFDDYVKKYDSAVNKENFAKRAAFWATCDARVIETSVSYLGLGIQPPTPSWGNMLKNAQDLIWSAPWVAILPGIMIFITTMSINFMGDAIRDALNPQMQIGRG